MALYGYARVSTGRQATEGDSLETQERKIAAHALSEGLAVTKTFVEAGVSGSVPLGERPEGAALLKLLRKGDVVVASKLDRIFRDAKDALNTAADLRDRGVSLIIMDLGGDVTSNGVGKLFFTILAAVATFERERISDRQKDAKAAAAARGVYRGGKRPYGYVAGPDGALHEVESEQRMIAEARGRRAAGWPLRRIREHIIITSGQNPSLDTIARVTADVASAAERAGSA